jgi:TolA-binding protein
MMALLSPFAKLLLAVAAPRDKYTAKACSYLEELANRYPQNGLYRKERDSRCR